MISVSHDRKFIEEVCDECLLLTKDGLEAIEADSHTRQDSL